SKMRKFILRWLSGGLKLFAESEEGHVMDGLTTKQKELFPLFILGKSDAEIAQLTNLPEMTVAKHRYEIYKSN
ncbi:MAG: response regulator transcription factor, partial [Candidatus Omnitrophica bacterium]|nr:response regulator transcription factor [Candidatus Omnitrophota bacterium]